MTTFMDNDQWAQQKNYDYFKGFSVTALAAASITTGWYFFYNNGTVSYYVWMDKNGNGTTDDPGPIAGFTSLAVDISAASTAATVATAIATAIDATASSASSLGAVVTILNASANENNSSLTDSDTTFTIATLGYALKNETPTAQALTLYRRRLYGNINKYIPGAPDTNEYGDTFLDIEYRGVELIIDDEQGRNLEEGRNMYIPRDYIYKGDREALAGMAAGGSFNRGISH